MDPVSRVQAGSPTAGPQGPRKPSWKRWALGRVWRVGSTPGGASCEPELWVLQTQFLCCSLGKQRIQPVVLLLAAVVPTARGPRLRAGTELQSSVCLDGGACDTLISDGVRPGPRRAVGTYAQPFCQSSMVGGCLGWSAPPRRPGSGAFTRKVARWDSTGSKPGTTHVAKHLHPILAEDQRIHTAEEIFEHSEYEEISIHLVTHTREIPP